MEFNLDSGRYNAKRCLKGKFEVDADRMEFARTEMKRLFDSFMADEPKCPVQQAVFVNYKLTEGGKH